MSTSASLPFISEFRILTRIIRHPQSITKEMAKRIPPTTASDKLVFANKNEPTNKMNCNYVDRPPGQLSQLTRSKGGAVSPFIFEFALLSDKRGIVIRRVVKGPLI